MNALDVNSKSPSLESLYTAVTGQFVSFLQSAVADTVRGWSGTVVTGSCVAGATVMLAYIAASSAQGEQLDDPA